MWETSAMDKTYGKVLVNEILEGLKFKRRWGVHGSGRNRLSRLKIDLQVIRPMFRECLSMTFAKYISKIMIFFGDTAEVNWVSGRRGAGIGLGSGQLNSVHFGTRKLTSAYKSSTTNKWNVWQGYWKYRGCRCFGRSRSYGCLRTGHGAGRDWHQDGILHRRSAES